MSIEVRVAEVADYDRVAEIMLAAYGSVPGFRLEGAYAAELADVAGRSALTTLFVAVDTDGARVVGAVTYLDDASSPYAQPMGGDEAALRMLAVDPASQGRGVGAALIAACVERAREAGAARLVLHTTEWMTSGRRLYERLGFRRSPERDSMVEDRIHLLSYVLDLAP
ncbi:MAG: GNAT family N-acetyltransferase [Acidimicrobiales bacterium]